MMFLFIKFFSITEISLLFCYAVGAVITRVFKISLKERVFALFLSLVVGLSVIVGLYAVICTRGNTIQLPIVLLILVAAWVLKNQSSNDSSLITILTPVSRTGILGLPILLILAGIVFCMQYFILYDSHSEYLQTPPIDYVYYSRLSLPLNHLGLETNSLEAVYTQFLTQQPYHYFEIWLNAALVRITGLPSAWMFFTSSTAILLTIIILGFAALFTHFQMRAIWAFVFAILFLFVTGVRWPFLQHYDFVANGALLSSTLLCLQPKLAPIYMFTLLVGLLLLNKYYVASGAALAILPLCFVSTAPVIGVGTVVVVSYLAITRQLLWRKAFAMVIPIVVSTLYIILFYALHPEPYQFPNTGRSFALQSIVPQLSEAKRLFNSTVGVFINYTIYFVAYGILLLSIVLLRHQSRLLIGVPSVIWVWFGISLVMSAIMRAFGTHYLDSFQFFSNVMLPLTPVILVIILAVLLQHAAAGMYFLATGFLLSLIIINLFATDTGLIHYSPQFLQKISSVAPRMGRRGAYILADIEYRNAYNLSSDSYTIGNYISNFKNDYEFDSLSELDIDSVTTDVRFKYDSVQAGQIIRQSSIYRFAKFQVMNQCKLSLDSIKYKFVIDNNIKFICASREAKLPLLLQKLVLVMYTDDLSGERFYLLNSEKRVASLNAYD